MNMLDFLPRMSPPWTSALPLLPIAHRNEVFDDITRGFCTIGLHFRNAPVTSLAAPGPPRAAASARESYPHDVADQFDLGRATHRGRAAQIGH